MGRGKPGKEEGNRREEERSGYNGIARMRENGKGKRGRGPGNKGGRGGSGNKGGGSDITSFVRAQKERSKRRKNIALLHILY